jgi:Tfp pilus assembly protein PilV
VASAVVIVIGVLLMGVGALGFVSATTTNNDSQTTKDQVAALEQETSALQQDRDAREAETETATTAKRKLTTDVQTVRFAVLSLHNVTHAAVAAGNALSDCDSISDNTAFIACTNSALAGYESAITAELDAVAETRTAIATLEEDLGA